jgi:hypothetical protein
MNWNLKTYSVQMLMKRILMYCLAVGWMSAFAQEPELDRPQDPKAAERINNLRIAYLTEKLELTPEQAERFWPVYREFSQERAKLRREFMTAQRAIDPNNPDPAKQKELVDLELKVRQRQLDLEKDYSQRLLKVISAQQVLNLRQGEREFVDLLKGQIQQRRMNQQRKENVRDRNQRLQQRN